MYAGDETRVGQVDLLLATLCRTGCVYREQSHSGVRVLHGRRKKEVRVFERESARRRANVSTKVDEFVRVSHFVGDAIVVLFASSIYRRHFWTRNILQATIG